MWVPYLGREDPLEEEMATHSSILAWKIPWAEEPGGLRSMGLQKAGRDWAEPSLPEGTFSSTELINSVLCSSPPLCSSVTIVIVYWNYFCLCIFLLYSVFFKGRLCVFIFAYSVSTLLGSIDSQMLVEWVQGVFRGLWENWLNQKVLTGVCRLLSQEGLAEMMEQLECLAEGFGFCL